MSYQVIARKWRPQSFDEVSGQAHVTTALRNAIRTDRIPHAMLLTGPRGVGKTTLARLIARCLNCEKGPTDQPCGSCPPCVEITEGRSTDVQEIDAASRTGVDDMREVIESIRYAAAPGKYRIFIVDEVHMLSGAAFNALLKTLEEPPPRSLFVFATTNPEKIPFTVLSRCQRHDLRRIALASVSDRLAEICEAEGIQISAGALSAIAREGDGSMRDAQTLLDQIIAYFGGGEGAVGSDAGTAEITNEIVADVLDLVDRNVLRAVVEACIAGDAQSALEHVTRAAAGGSEARRIADALLELLRDLVVLGVAPKGEGLFEGPEEERAELIELAGRSEPARLRRMFRALVREIEDLSWAPQPMAVLEMAVIRLATMPSGDDVSQLLTRLDQLERRLANASPSSGSPGRGSGGAGGGPVADRGPKRRVAESGADSEQADHAKTSAPTPSASSRTEGAASRAQAERTDAASALPGATSPVASPPPASFKTPPAPERPERPANGRKAEAAPEPPPQSASMPSEPARFQEAEEAPAAAPSQAGRKVASRGAPPRKQSGNGSASPKAGAPRPAPTIGGGAEPRVLFDRFRSKALDTDRSRFASLDGTRLLGIEGNLIRIGAPAAFHAERLRHRVDELTELATRFFGQPTRIAVEIASQPSAREESSGSREHSRKRRQEALNSESVNLAIEVLEAEIVEIRPLGDPS